MVITTGPTITFKTEALNVIWAEIEQMRNARDNYSGIAFQQAHHYDISVLYALSSCLMGQEHHHPLALWKDICLSMRLIGQVVHDHRLPDIVRLCEDVVWGSTRWAIYPKELREDLLLVVFQRVDEVIFVLRKHLELPSS